MNDDACERLREELEQFRPHDEPGREFVRRVIGTQPNWSKNTGHKHRFFDANPKPDDRCLDCCETFADIEQSIIRMGARRRFVEQAQTFLREYRKLAEG